MWHIHATERYSAKKKKKKQSSEPPKHCVEQKHPDPKVGVRIEHCVTVFM